MYSSGGTSSAATNDSQSRHHAAVCGTVHRVPSGSTYDRSGPVQNAATVCPCSSRSSVSNAITTFPHVLPLYAMLTRSFSHQLSRRVYADAESTRYSVLGLFLMNGSPVPSDTRNPSVVRSDFGT